MSWKITTSSYYSGGYNYRLAVDISVSSQSVANNSTTLSYRVYTDNDDGSSAYIAYLNRSVRINGTTIYDTSAHVYGYKNQTLKTGTITVPHNSDGSKSVDVSLSAVMYYSSGTPRTGSQTITLTKIDRGIYDFALGKGWDRLTGEKSVTFKKYDSNTRVHVVTAWWDYTTSTKTVHHSIVNSSGTEITNSGSGHTFFLKDTVIDDIKKATPNNWKGYVYVTAWVYAGDKQIETHSIEVPGIIVSEAEPDLSFTAKFTGTNQSLLESTTRGLKGVHSLRLTLSSSPKDYATIKRYEITFEGKTTTTTGSSVTLVPTKSGSSSVSVKVFDSRDWTTTSSQTVQVINYGAPKLSHRAFRVEDPVTLIENPVGTIGHITGAVSIASVKDSSGKEVNAPWWRLSIYDNNAQWNRASITYSQALDIDEQKAYTLQYGDKFTTASVNGVIPLGQAPLVLGKEAVGINIVPPVNGKGLYIQDSLINGKKILEENDLIDLGGNANGYYAKFSNGLLVCWKENLAIGAPTTQAAQVWMSNSTTWTFPHAFSLIPYCGGMPRAGRAGAWLALGDSASSVTQASFKLYYPYSNATTSTASVFAIGHWR